MFDNIGGKIKGLTTAIAVIGIGISVIAGIILMFTISFLSGLLVAVVGGVSCYVGSFFAYGFGQLIENSDILVAEIKKGNSSASSEGNAPEKKEFVSAAPVAAAPVAAAPVAAAPKPTAPAPVQRIKVDTPDVPVKVTKNGSGDLICPACGTQQRDNRFRCLKCGVKFINGQPSIPYWCGSCGQEGPFEGACPKCNSTVKIMNIHQ